ncbi:MAG: hypothetical protein LBU32_23480 [Clostridiales bacterium]|nr:hypothetical protein [Clostridiales bacterium]
MPSNEIDEVYGYLSVFLGCANPEVFAFENLGDYIDLQLPRKIVKLSVNVEKELFDYEINALKQEKKYLEVAAIANESELESKKLTSKREIEALQIQSSREELWLWVGEAADNNCG